MSNPCEMPSTPAALSCRRRAFPCLARILGMVGLLAAMPAPGQNGTSAERLKQWIQERREEDARSAREQDKRVAAGWAAHVAYVPPESATDARKRRDAAQQASVQYWEADAWLKFDTRDIRGYLQSHANALRAADKHLAAKGITTTMVEFLDKFAASRAGSARPHAADWQALLSSTPGLKDVDPQIMVSVGRLFLLRGGYCLTWQDFAGMEEAFGRSVSTGYGLDGNDAFDAVQNYKWRRRSPLQNWRNAGKLNGYISGLRRWALDDGAQDATDARAPMLRVFHYPSSANAGVLRAGSAELRRFFRGMYAVFASLCVPEDHLRGVAIFLAPGRRATEIGDLLTRQYPGTSIAGNLYIHGNGIRVEHDDRVGTLDDYLHQIGHLLQARLVEGGYLPHPLPEGLAEYGTVLTASGRTKLSAALRDIYGTGPEPWAAVTDQKARYEALRRDGYGDRHLYNQDLVFVAYLMATADGRATIKSALGRGSDPSVLTMQQRYERYRGIPGSVVEQTIAAHLAALAR